MGKKYTTDEIEVGGHMLDASMMTSLNTVVTDSTSYMTTLPDHTHPYLPLTGGTLTGSTILKGKSYLDGTHGDARFQIRRQDTTTEGDKSYLTLWASEPGITHSSAGIGGNINSGGQYYGRQSAGAGWGAYLRFNVSSGHNEFWSTTGNPGAGGGKGSKTFYVDGSGNSYAVASSRAPVFYDSNNTGYYVNPSSTSNFNVVNSSIFSGTISTSGDGQNNTPFKLGSDYNSYMVAAAGNTWGLFWAGNNGARYGTNGLGGPGNIWGNSTNPNEFVFVGSDSTKWTVHGTTGKTWQAGTGQSATDFRAPIFYDSNNTGYYLNPASTSNLNALTVGGSTVATQAWVTSNANSSNANLLDGLNSTQFLRSDANDSFTGNLTTGAGNHITFGPNTTWGSSLRIGGNGHTATGTEMASVVTTDGNLHLDAADSTSSIYLNFYAGTGGVKFGNGAGTYNANMTSSGILYANQVRATLFYDSDNTGYYVNPAGTSSLSSLSSATSSTGTTTIQSLRFQDGADSGNGVLNYAIYQEGGAWTYPYPDLVIGMHTGIKIGGDKGYGGTRFYSDAPGRTGAVELFSVGKQDLHTRVNYDLIVSDAVKAPIFYDSNNTGYYVNPASTSYINRLELNDDLDMRGQVGVWITSDVFGDAIGWNTNYGVYIGSNVGGTHYLRGNGTFTTGGSTYNLWHAGNFTPSNYLLTTGKAADSNLLDGIDSASFLRSDAGDSFSGTLVGVAQRMMEPDNFGKGVYGKYNSSRFQHVWGMGNSWHMSTSGTSLGNFYGIAYTHPNVGVGSQSGFSHQTLFVENGVPRTWIGQGVRTVGDLISDTSVKAPNFYDLDNTGYYVNPAGISNLNTLSVNGDLTVSGTSNLNTLNVTNTVNARTRAVAITGFGSGEFTFYQASGTFEGFSGWHNYFIGNHGDGSSYYNTTIAMPFWGPPRYSRKEGGTDRGPYEFWTSERTIVSTFDITAPIFRDSDNTTYYLDPAGTSNLGSLTVSGTLTASLPYSSLTGVPTAFEPSSHTHPYLPLTGGTLTGDITVGSGQTSSNIYMADSNGTARRIHTNSSRIGFLTSGNGWGSYCFNNGDWKTDMISYAGASMRAPIFYDVSDTGYYVDPASTSNLNSVNVTSVINVPYINTTEPVESYNPFGAYKQHDGVLTNAMAGRHNRFDVTIDGTIEAGASAKLSNQNFEEYNQNRLFGTSAGETKVFNINVQKLATGSVNSNGITYSSGFFDICFYSNPFPASWSARVKDRNGNWTTVSNFTKIGNSKLRGVIPIGNYLTDIEFTLTARTSAPFVTGNITYGIAEFELFFSRMAASQGGNLSALGGYVGGTITSDGRIQTTDNMRAPVFYDSDNTVYNLNPASTSTIDGLIVQGLSEFNSNSHFEYNVNVAGTLDGYLANIDYLGLGAAPNTSGSYRLNMVGNIDMNNNTIDYLSQLHFQDNVRFYDDGNDSYLNFKYGDTNSGGIRIRNGAGTQKGYLYADASGFGLLDSDGVWAVRTRTGTSPLELRCDNNPEFYVYDSYTLSPGSSRAPIFYDSDDTSYNLNPAGTSTLNRVNYINNTIPIVVKVNSAHKSWAHHVSSNDDYVIVPSGTDGGENWVWNSGFNFKATGDIMANNFLLRSDERLKTKITDLPCDNIDVAWKSFELKSDEGNYRTGVIAQELEKTNPEFVDTDDKGFKSVKYVDLLIAKIAELEARLEKLEK
jgi:hypothetical protein